MIEDASVHDRYVGAIWFFSDIIVTKEAAFQNFYGYCSSWNVYDVVWPLHFGAYSNWGQAGFQVLHSKSMIDGLPFELFNCGVAALNKIVKYFKYFYQKYISSKQNFCYKSSTVLYQVSFWGKTIANKQITFVRMNQASCVCLLRQHRTPLFAVLFASL